MVEEKPTIARKTLEKVQWVRKNYSKYQFNLELIDAMVKEFDICAKHAKRIIRMHTGKQKNTSNWKQKSGIKERIGSKEHCYFCLSSINLVNHHSSYKPEVVVCLCKSCHNKIHQVCKNITKIMSTV